MTRRNQWQEADWPFVAISATAFFIYVLMMGDTFPLIHIPKWIATLAMLLFIPLTPYILPDRTRDGVPVRRATAT